MLIWKAGPVEAAKLQEVKLKNHPNLELATIALAFCDAKPFIRNKFNWGKVSKFSPLSKIWIGEQYEMAIVISSDAWLDICNDAQREALLDLNLSRISPKYLPETIEENGKQVKVKDERGCTKYSTNIKYNDDGSVCWEVAQLDISVFSKSISRYGLWYEDLLQIKQAIDEHEEKQA
jgi:hypothetical protein